jgi:hypothetical protein
LLDSVVPSSDREPLDGQKRYTVAELIELRHQMLRFSRSLPPGPERNQHRQVAMSLRRLFKNKAWLDANTVEGSQ